MSLARGEDGKLVSTAKPVLTMEEAMAEAAALAAKELEGLPREHINTIATWWKSWYMKAGHKRLGRALLGFAKK